MCACVGERRGVREWWNARFQSSLDCIVQVLARSRHPHRRPALCGVLYGLRGDTCSRMHMACGVPLCRLVACRVVPACSLGSK